MIDKKLYEKEVSEARINQINEVSSYLSEYIQKIANIRDKKVYTPPTQEQLEKIEKMSIPLEGRNSKEVADEIVHDVFETSMFVQHPRFFSFVSSAVSPYSLAGSILTDIYNVHGGGYEEAPGPCIIENKIIKWMASLAGYNQDQCGGLFLSGGSMANLSAIVAARDNKLLENDFSKGVAYLSDQTHSSIRKALRILGFRNDQIKVIPSDDDFKMDTNLLKEEIKKDLNNNTIPFLVVGTLGTTNTGSIDPLEKIGDICTKHHLWFHIDGAYGASVLLSSQYRYLAKGIELSDSFSWDSHKWAMQTYSCSSLICKDKKHLIRSFAEHPEYLEDVISSTYTDPWDLGPEMTRPHRAIKLWFTLQAMGTRKLAEVIDFAFYNASLAQEELLKHPNWEIASKPMCGAINFRFSPKNKTEEELDEINSEISRQINEDGYTYIVTTILKSKKVLRMCLLNANTNDEDIINTISYLDDIAKKIINQ